MRTSIKKIEDVFAKQQQYLLPSPPAALLRSTFNFLKNYQPQNLKHQKQTTKLMKIICSIFFIQSPHQQMIMQIYQRFVSELSSLRHFECNNFATMLYNMKAYLLLQQNESREYMLSYLKKINQYSQEKNNSDIPLVALNLNNIAVLYLNDSEYQKSFTYSLKAYENIKHQLLVLKKNKDPTLANKVSIFVNSCYLIKESLYGRVHSNQIETKYKKEYLEYIELFHNQGEKAARKYLGNESYLLKLLQRRQNKHVSVNFSKDIVWKHELPVFYLNASDIAKEKMIKMASYLTQRVNPRLDSLLNTILRSQEHRKTIPPPPPPPSPPPEPEPQSPPPTVIQQETILLQMTKHFPQTKKFSIKIKIIQGKNNRFGKITLSIISNSKLISKQQIQQSIVQILVKQISRDCAPYDTHIQGCSPQQLAEYFILPYVYFQNNQITVQPHCSGLFKQSRITFFGFQSYVFVNHIRSNQFRIVICPMEMVESFHINVVVNDAVMDQLIKDYEDNYIQDPKIQNLLRVCKGENPILDRDIERELVVTEPVLTNPDLLQDQIPAIIRGFQKFITQHKFCPRKIKMLFKHKKKTYRYFKYVIEEFKTGKGCYYGIKNIDKNKTIDVVLENTHESFCPTGKIRAKGYHEVEYSLLYFEFGVQQCTKYQVEEVLEVFAMVSELYHLHIYENELEKDEKELYGENAIRVGKLVGRTGKRVCSLTDNYPSIITAQVVTINSQIPLGVKVTIYNTEHTLENGFFLRLDKRRWLKQKPKNNNMSLKQSKMSSNKSSTSIFSNRRVKQQPPALLNYLFTPILTTAGFDILIRQLKYYEDREYFGLKQTLGNPKFGKLEDFLPLDEIVAQYEEVKKLIQKNNNREDAKPQKSPNKLYPNK